MLRRTIAKTDRLIIVESPNKTSKITSILQSHVTDWTFGGGLNGSLAKAANPYGGAGGAAGQREGVAVMATIGHFMDTKDVIISSSDLVIPSSSQLANGEGGGNAANTEASKASLNSSSSGKKGKGGKVSAAQQKKVAALLDLPPMPHGSPLLSFKPEIRLRPDNTSMETIVRYIQSNKNLVEVVLASDPDREGELIAVHALRYLMKKAGLGKAATGLGTHPILFSRAYIQSITEEGIIKAMRERKLGYCDFALAESASARHTMDRLFGWVGSTFMRRIDKSFVSVGRVQTPALILIRDQEQKIQEATEAYKASFIIQGKFNIFAEVEADSESEVKKSDKNKHKTDGTTKEKNKDNHTKEDGNKAADSVAAVVPQQLPIYTRQVNFQIEYAAEAETAPKKKGSATANSASSSSSSSSSATSAPSPSSTSSQFASKDEAERWLREQFGATSPTTKSAPATTPPTALSSSPSPPPLKMTIMKAPVITTGKQKPPQPHTMQSVLTAASSQLKISAEDATKCLQELFQAGLITYPRTDSTRIDESFVEESLRPYIKKQYGEKAFVDNQKNPKKSDTDGAANESGDGEPSSNKKEKTAKDKEDKKKKKAEKEGNVEDAHEALRPTSLDRHPSDPSVLALFGIGSATPATIEKRIDVVSALGGPTPPNSGGYNNTYNQYSRNNLSSCRSAFPVYRLIYQATLAAFMASAETETTMVTVGVAPADASSSSSSSPMLVAKLSATRLVQPGWRSAKLGIDAAAVKEAMKKGKAGAVDGASATDGTEGDGSADDGDEAAAAAAAVEETAEDIAAGTPLGEFVSKITTFDLINNFPQYLKGLEKESEAEGAKGKGGDGENGKKNKHTEKAKGDKKHDAKKGGKEEEKEKVKEGSDKTSSSSSSSAFVLPKNIRLRATVADLKVAEKAATLPKPFTEGSLIQSLKEHGVGRPSTYPTILKTLFDRKYITRDGSQRLYTTPTGQGVVRGARNAFPSLVDINFTASFERELNSISNFRVEVGPQEDKSGSSPSNSGSGSKKGGHGKGGSGNALVLSDPTNPDLGEGQNPLTCYTLSRLLYTLTGLVDSAVERHLLLQEYKLSDMRSIVAKSRELGAASTNNTNTAAATAADKTATTGAPTSSPLPYSSPLTSPSPLLAAYSATSLFDRDPTFSNRRDQIAWRLPKMNIPQLLQTIANGQYRVVSNNNTNGGSGGSSFKGVSNSNSNGGNSGSGGGANVVSNAATSTHNKGAAEVVNHLTLNVLTSHYFSRHLGLAVGYGAQLHTLGMDEAALKKMFACVGDRARLFAVSPKLLSTAATTPTTPAAVKFAPMTVAATAAAKPTTTITTTTTTTTSTASSLPSVRTASPKTPVASAPTSATLTTASTSTSAGTAVSSSQELTSKGTNAKPAKEKKTSRKKKEEDSKAPLASSAPSAQSAAAPVIAAAAPSEATATSTVEATTATATATPAQPPFDAVPTPTSNTPSSAATSTANTPAPTPSTPAPSSTPAFGSGATFDPMAFFRMGGGRRH